MKRFDLRDSGVGRIALYNRRFFALSVAGAIAAIAARRFVPSRAARTLLDAGAVATLYFTASSLVASFAVYDRSSLYAWTWLSTLVPRPRDFANVHAGLDESSDALGKAWPAARRDVVDLFDERFMTEPSIRIARASAPDVSGTIAGAFDAIPLPDESVDLVCLLFAAHEFRRRSEREALFSEAARIVRRGGHVVLVEHLRDARNYLAFGPGARHFYPHDEWRSLGRGAGLELERERRFAFLVAAFAFRKPALA